MAGEAHDHKVSTRWLIFFFLCYVMIMAIGAFAIFTYDANAPEKQPSGGGHGMTLPGDLPQDRTVLAA